MRKIHFIINALNEDHRLARVLDSIVPFSASIILVDAGSSDNTIAVAKTYPDVEIISSSASPFDLAGRFSDALELISSHDPDPWIFPITCSEVLTPSLGVTLLALINGPDELVGINMYRQSFTFGVPTHRRKLVYLIHSLSRRNSVRVFKAKLWRMDLGQIHQEYKVEPSKLHSVTWLLPREKSSLLHVRDGSLSDFERKHTFYSDRESEERLVKNEKSSLVKLFVLPALVFLYFLPGALFSKKALIVAVYHAFYKFQVQAKMLLRDISK